MRILRSLFKYLIILSLLYASWLMLNLSLPYLQMKSNVDFLKTKVFIYHIRYWRLSFYVHVFTSLLVLVAGLLQFISYIIRKQKRLHRISGYIYLIDVLFITGPAALFMSFYANGGIPARTSFVLLAVLWLTTTAFARRHAMKKNFIFHGNWMLRSYALTLSAITLRTYAFLFGYLHINMRPVPEYITIAWMSWIPNLIVAEILIKKGFIKSLFKQDTRSRPEVKA